MNKILLSAAIAMAAFASNSQAFTGNGTAGIAVIGLSDNVPTVPHPATIQDTGVNLNISSAVFTNSVSGDFASIPSPAGTAVVMNTPETFNPTPPETVGEIASWNFTSSLGDFVATSIIDVSNPATPTVLSIQVDGTFTGAGALAGLVATDSAAIWSFTQTGTSVSGSGTFDEVAPVIPPTSVPEPSGLALMAVGAAVLAFRKKQAA